MKYKRIIFYAVVVLPLGISLASVVQANLMVDINYVETKTSDDGWLQQDYTYTNLSSGFYLFQVDFRVDSDVLFRPQGVADGWYVDPEFEYDLQADEWILTFTGPPGNPAEISPGESLSGFSLQFKYQDPLLTNRSVGDLHFEAFFGIPQIKLSLIQFPARLVPFPSLRPCFWLQSGYLAWGLREEKSSEAKPQF